MTTLGLTGSRSVTAADLRPIIGDFREHFKSFDRFVTGACVGLDAVLGYILSRKYPNKDHFVIVPAHKKHIYAWWNFDYTEQEKRYAHLEIEHMPADSSYKARNQRIVSESDALFFVVTHAEEDERSLRSGSWQTIRLARDAGLPISGVVLDSGDIFV